MTVRQTALLVVLALALPATALAGGARKAPMTRPAADAPDEDAKGFVKIKGKNGAELFSVKIGQLAPDTEYSVYVEDAVDAGTFTLAGTITTNDDGNGKYKINVRRGDTLPGGAESSEDLAGRAVEVRGDDGLGDEETVLSGVIPDTSAKKSKPAKADADLEAGEDHDGECAGRVSAKTTPGTQQLKVKLKRADPGTYGVFMDDGTGAFVQVGEIVVPEGEDSGSWQALTARGDPLPFDAASVRDLAGRAVEVRDADGGVALDGAVPDVDARGKGKGKDKDDHGKPDDKPGGGDDDDEDSSSE